MNSKRGGREGGGFNGSGYGKRPKPSEEKSFEMEKKENNETILTNIVEEISNMT